MGLLAPPPPGPRFDVGSVRPSESVSQISRDSQRGRPVLHGGIDKRSPASGPRREAVVDLNQSGQGRGTASPRSGYDFRLPQNGCGRGIAPQIDIARWQAGVDAVQLSLNIQQYRERGEHTVFVSRIQALESTVNEGLVEQGMHSGMTVILDNVMTGVKETMAMDAAL
jgi:hypothetical protein